MGSILITNNVSEKLKIRAESVDKSKLDFYYGFLDKGSEIDSVVQGFLSAFFMSLVTHDSIYLKPADFGLVLNKIGAGDAVKLLESRAVKVILGTDEFVIKDNGPTLGLNHLKFDWSEIDGVEKRLPSSIDVKLRSRLIQYVDNSSVRADGLGNIILSELKSDLARKSFREDLAILTESTSEVLPHDGYRIMRISQCAQSLVLQNKLGIESIYQDAYVKSYVDSKFGSFSRIAGHDPVAGFEKVLGLKGIPDIYSLYDKGVISVDEILACRKSFNGEIFRKWYSKADYDGQALVSALMSPVKQSAASKFIRLIYPNVIGVMNPLLGFAANVADSYLVDKLIGGWRPSLFLDNVLKVKIDDKVRLYEAKMKREQIISRFGSVERNEICPCQSGKKFKKCHGS